MSSNRKRTLEAVQSDGTFFKELFDYRNSKFKNVKTFTDQVMSYMHHGKLELCIGGEGMIRDALGFYPDDCQIPLVSVTPVMVTAFGLEQVLNGIGRHVNRQPQPEETKVSAKRLFSLTGKTISWVFTCTYRGEEREFYLDVYPEEEKMLFNICYLADR